MDAVHKEFTTMKFRDFLVSEINKGLARQFQQEHPNLPKYVAKQVLQNRVAPLWRNTVVSKSPTVGWTDNRHPKLKAMQQTMIYSPATENDPSKPTYKSLGDMFKDNSVSSIANRNNWKLELVELHPLQFTQDTINAFLNHQFGSSPSLSKGVKNHDERMQVQSALAGERGEENEPIIMVREGDKYKMQEGWHRLYSYLTKFSAPPKELEKIHRGQSHTVDFNVWRPIKIRAYIGD